MKSFKLVMALLLVVGFVFVVAAYAQLDKAEKAAEKTDKAELKEAAKEAPAEGQPVDAKKLAADEKKTDADKDAQKAAEKVDKAEQKEAVKESEEAGKPVSAASMKKDEAATEKERQAEKAAEKLDKEEIKADEGMGKKKDIVEMADALKEFKTLVELLKIAGLTDTLKGKGPFTVFAPVDAAFAKIPAAELDALKKDKEKLAGILKMHVAEGKLSVADLMKMKEVKTLNGTVALSVKDEVLSFGGIKVSAVSDADCSNGVIHAIDAVLVKK